MTRHNIKSTDNDPSKIEEGKKYAQEYVWISQAERVVTLFGGRSRLHKALAAIGFHISYGQLILWNKPREKNGTGGVIPPRAIVPILEAARYEGVHIGEGDLSPVPTRVLIQHTLKE